MSHARLSANPPPTAGPLTAAIHGLRDRWMRSCSVARWSCHMNPIAVRPTRVAARRSALVLQVESGGEAAPCAGDDDCPEVWVEIDGADDLVEFGDHRGGHRIEPFGAMQRDECDVLVDLADLDGLERVGRKCHQPMMATRTDPRRVVRTKYSFIHTFQVVRIMVPVLEFERCPESSSPSPSCRCWQRRPFESLA